MFFLVEQGKGRSWVAKAILLPLTFQGKLCISSWCGNPSLWTPNIAFVLVPLV
ncbi:hypothetical protein RchiOBHm_Chr5g0068551 [Rosa chinensis]|uniref:Uncharacterized protein n=1 Tax=Rosa chinensis TaxID=74649 RepID=A0A2P6QJQ6_ROSCH|nr:hypothetical protein RchiOBHm_Chr5g0068551 [Rosa chinensis]